MVVCRLSRDSDSWREPRKLAPRMTTSNSSNIRKQKSVTADQCRDFLVAVANAEDKALSAGTRRRFEKRYRDWFPKDILADDFNFQIFIDRLHYHGLSWLTLLPEFGRPSKGEGIARELRSEEKPQNELQWHVAMLREALCEIWKINEIRDARYALGVLWHFTRDYRRWGYSLPPPGVPDWRIRTLAAFDWMDKNLHRLRICTNPECRETRYFVREENSQKYCRKACAERGQELKREEQKRSEPRKRVLSEEAKRAISRAQKKRWRKYRADKELRLKTSTEFLGK
jgi:hypothetical protein